MKIGTLTTGDTVATTINLQYLPQFISFEAATALTSIKVNVAGDGVIVDLDSAGIIALTGIRKFGKVTNNYMIPLSDGFIPNKVVEITIVNSGVQTPAIYGFSLQKGLAYVVTRRQTILASSGVVIRKFAHLALDTLGVNDELTIKFVDGHVQKMTVKELKNWYTLFAKENSSASVDNMKGMIDYVHVIPSANRVAYITKFHAVGDIN